MRDVIDNIFPNGWAWFFFLLSDCIILLAAILIANSFFFNPEGLEEVVNMHQQLLDQQSQFLIEAKNYINTDLESTSVLLSAVSSDRWTATDMEIFLEYLRETHPDLFKQLPDTNYFKQQYLRKISLESRTLE